MSKCISKHGEYSEHELGNPEDPFCCQRCFTVDEDAIMAALRSAEAERDRLAAKVARVEAVIDSRREIDAVVRRSSIGAVGPTFIEELDAALAEEPPDA